MHKITKKTVFTALCGLIFTASLIIPTQAAPSQQDPTFGLRQQLLQTRMKLELDPSGSWEIGEMQIGFGKPFQSFYISARVDPGNQYKFIAIGDGNVKDLDGAFVQDNRKVFAQDTRPTKDIMITTNEIKHGQPITIVIRMNGVKNDARGMFGYLWAYRNPNEIGNRLTTDFLPPMF